MGPAVALLVFAIIVVAAALVFWPGRGVLARLTRGLRSTDRVLLEDTLKHLYTCEAVGRACVAGTVAEHLGVSDGRAEALLERLEASDLVHAEAGEARLTDAGRESALHLVRAHRLWERYLADRTGVPPAEWHAEAERMEHALGPDEADVLASRLGHPRWDPHGDPIPTAAGDLPDLRGVALSDVDPPRTVEIVHLEDEPPEIYEALLDDGIELGARLDVLARDSGAVRVHLRDREWSIPQEAARNVTVRPLPEGATADSPVETLLDIVPGERARVTEISPACQGVQRRRLLDLGVVKGTEIEAELMSAAGDPIAYRIRGALIALRRQQAEWIRIERLPGLAEESNGTAPDPGARIATGADA
jgi:DtxR family Mn-dependent transcriptional regulator